MVERKKKGDRAFKLIITILAQSMLVIFMAAYIFIREEKISRMPLLPSHEWLPLLTGLGVFLALASLFLVLDLERLANLEVQAHERVTRLEKAEEMVKVLRAQRHDFLNHLSVISGFIQLRKLEDATNYVKIATGELAATGRVINLAAPELAALVLSKKEEADAMGASFGVDIRTNLGEVYIKPDELVRIAGNLIDNALYASKVLPGEDRAVRLEIGESRGMYYISVTNTGTPIPGEIREKIFQPGYTTKGGDGSGYGLHIVRSLAEKNGGKVWLESGESETTFTVYLPRQGKQKLPENGKQTAER